ncbi:hypothetical protein EXIGLDRAFT_774635 [Exidia glandulosa HHB12029]|uniref:Coilin n=1 Tax=Exidia glandulosa HHB12029 TaxID=1314781 RepID=A0A165E9V7_EXIGL|nr:hypothetical protein EXIGLDRAFT_774635 [Exidia glandulosa HHB12029]
MRIRLNAAPPLPSYKAWYVFPGALRDDTTASVRDLKRALCDSIFPDCPPEELAFFVEGYELLDNTPLEVVQADDILNVKQTVTRTTITKRKTRDEDVPDQSAKKRLKVSATAASSSRPRSPSTSSSSSSSASSSSSSASSSSTSSDSDSDSDSSSTSSSLHVARKPVPKPNSKALHPLSGYGHAAEKPKFEHLVPPGQGKPATQARNARRRRKRLGQRQPGDTSLGSSEGPSAPPEGPTHSSVAAALPVQVTAMMLRNKGKRKSFLTSGPDATNTPSRIVFPTSDSPATAQKLPRLVPPSERDDLPANVLVTSVDVEADLWGKRNRRRSARFSEPAPYVEEEEAEVVFVKGSAKAVAPAPALDIKWPMLARILSSPAVGAMLAWQTLDINPATLSPEMMIRTGNVVAVNADAGTVQLAVTRAEVAFGAALTDEEEEEIEELEVSLADILDKDDWRLLS